MRHRLPPAELDRLRARLTPTEADAASLAELALAQVRRRVATQGASGGQPWPPKRDGSPALVGIEDTFAAAAEGPAAVVGSAHPAAAAHQAGDAGRGLPARPLLPTSDAERAEQLAHLGRRLAERP